MPPGVALGQSEAGAGGHVVELVGTGVADVPGAQPDAALGDGDDGPVDGLGGRVTSGDLEHHPVGVDHRGGDGAGGGIRFGAGHEGLDHEGAARAQPPGHIFHAAPLRRGRGQVEQGVVRSQDHGEAAGYGDAHVGEVAQRHRDGVTSRLGPEALDHGRGGVDAVHLEAGCRQRQGQATRADPELEDRPTVSHRGHEGDGGIDVGDVAVPVVVDIGEALTVGRGVEALHRRIIAGGRRRCPVHHQESR